MIPTASSPRDTWLFLLNPQAGLGKALDRWAALESVLLDAGVPYQLLESEAPRDLIRLGREAASGKWKRVVVVGGDGSLHEVVNGMLESGVTADSMPPVTVFPVGSGNDWVRSWRIPSDPSKWWDQAQRWPVQPHGAGEVTFSGSGGPERRYFAGVCGMVFDGLLTRQIEDKPAVKNSQFVYILMTLRNLAVFKPQPVEVRSGDFRFEGDVLSINAGVVPYSGGGMRLVPHAQPQGTTFALTVIEAMSPLMATLRFWRAFDGSLGKVKGVHTLHGETLEVQGRGDQPIYIEADGEVLGQCPCSLRFLPGAFRIFAPVPAARS